MNKEKIKVGDEIVAEGKTVLVVCFVNDRIIAGMDKTGCGTYCTVHDAVKTGRHFHEIDEVLKKMNESERS